MTDNNLNSYDVKEIRRQIILMMLPIIAESFLQMFTDLIATAMVGRLVEIDISAQGMGGKIINLVYYIYRGTSVALVIMIAKRLTQPGGRGASRTIFEKAAVATIVISAVCCGMIYMKPELFLQMFTKDAELIAHAVGYLKILVFCLPFWGLTVCIAGVFQANGDTKTPMLVAVFVNILNTILCWGLIFGNLGMKEMGYLGAALGLVLSRAAGCLLSIYLLYSRRFGLFAVGGKRDREEKVLKNVYAIALPNAVEWIMWQVATIIVSRVILYYGQTEFASYQLGVQIETILEIPAIGFTTVAVALVSKALGLGDPKLYAVYKKEMARMCTGISIVTTAILIFMPRTCMYMLTDNESLVQAGVAYLVIMGFIQTPMNLGKIYSGILRSAGHNTMPLKIQTISMWGIRVPFCLACCYLLHLPIYAIWIIFALDQTFKCAANKYMTETKPII